MTKFPGIKSQLLKAYTFSGFFWDFEILLEKKSESRGFGIFRDFAFGIFWEKKTPNSRDLGFGNWDPKKMQKKWHFFLENHFDYSHLKFPCDSNAGARLTASRKFDVLEPKTWDIQYIIYYRKKIMKHWTCTSDLRFHDVEFTTHSQTETSIGIGRKF